ncbi:unnamed protein product [Lathyrus oleraceus]
MNEPIVPWKFLDFLGETKGMMKKVWEEKQLVSLKPPKSFVEAVNNVCDIPVSQLPKLCAKGDHLSIIIPEEGYILGVEAYKHNFHGRVLWPKGSSPLTVQNLK